MKKYLGSGMDRYVAIIAPILMVIFPILFSIQLIIIGGFESLTIVLVCIILSSIICFASLAKNSALQWYSWGIFDSESVTIKTLFSKNRYVFKYDECYSLGIGFYIHGVLNSTTGSTVRYIYFSKDRFDESYRHKMNMFKSNDRQIKVGFNKKLYNYLISVLPKQQAFILQYDYNRIIAKQ